MEQQKAMGVVELVIREQECIAALPAIVRSIRQYIQAPLLARLKSVMLLNSSTSRVEQILTMDSEDRRLVALECGHREQQFSVSSAATETLSTAETKVVCDVFWLGVQHARLQVVEWALATSALLPINEALEMAVDNGHVSIVQALYPRVGDFGCCKNEDELLESAASNGHLEVLKWLIAYRSKKGKKCFLLVAMRCAAGGGHLNVVKWIHANEPGKWTHIALEQAVLHGQQHVMDWIYQERLPVTAAFAIGTAAWKGNWTTLAWLYDKYPADTGESRTVKRRRLSS